MTIEPVAGEATGELRGALPEAGIEELYDDAPVGYLTTTPEGVIIRVNRTFLGLSGHEADELVGRKRFYDLLPPGAKIYYETHYAPLLELQREVREIALELNRPNGSRVPVLVNARVKPRDAGDVILITVFDATARRQYERELLAARTEAESRAAAASALHHVKEAVVLVDHDGKAVVLNRAACRLFDVVSDEVLGLPLVSFVPGWRELAGRVPIGHSGDPADSLVLPLELGDRTRWVAASGETSADGTVYTLRDVTDEQRLQELRDDIVTVVSHELRTPLASVLGAAQTLSELGESLDDGSRRELVTMIVEQGGRLARILDEILLTQRLDADRVAAVRETFALVPEVERIVRASREWRHACRIEIVVAEEVEASADPELFEQVLVNLLDNACKYGPEDGTIAVRVERHRASARVTVSDEGPGVPSDQHERIFEKFLRLDPDQIGGVAGTGLGLYISRELARRMHGQVGLLPGGPGATFYVDLPAAT